MENLLELFIKLEKEAKNHEYQKVKIFQLLTKHDKMLTLTDKTKIVNMYLQINELNRDLNFNINDDWEILIEKAESYLGLEIERENEKAYLIIDNEKTFLCNISESSSNKITAKEYFIYLVVEVIEVIK